MTEKARACLSGTERLLPLIFLLLVRGNDRALRSARPASHQTRVKAKKCRARDPHLNAICYRSDHDIMICGRIHILEFIFPYNESSSKSVVAVVFYSHFHTRICCCRPFYTYIFIFVAFHSLFLMMSKTYGDKPLVFAFDGDGEQYMIGSQVGNYLRLFRGALYKKFPGLARRNLTNDERRKLIDMGHSQHVTSSTISLLLAREVEDLLAGR